MTSRDIINIEINTAMISAAPREPGSGWPGGRRL